jgi:hypothetical protein
MLRPGAQGEKDARRCSRTWTTGGWMTPSAPAAGSPPSQKDQTHDGAQNRRATPSIQIRPAAVGSTLRDAQPAGVETKTKPRPRKRKGKSHKQLSHKRNPDSLKSDPTRRCNSFPAAYSTGSHDGNALLRTSPRAIGAASSTRHRIHPRRHTPALA